MNPEKEGFRMRFNHFCVTVKDMERSLVFYRDALGLKVAIDEIQSSPGLDKAVMESSAKIRMVMLADESENLPVELIEWKSRPPIERPTEHLGFSSTGLGEICFSVPDLEKLEENLKKYGFEFRTPVWTFETGGMGIKVTHAVDPDGVQVELIEL